MGNANPIGSSWLYPSEHKTLVLLCLKDARNIRPPPGEEVVAVVSAVDSPPVQIRIGQHCKILVSADSLLSIEIATASPIGAAAGNLNSFGELTLCLENLAIRCGRSVYYTWFPLQSGIERDYTSASAGGSVETMEHFDKELRSVARDPRLPMVCLSLCPTDAPEAKDMIAGYEYDVNVDWAEKCARFPGLMASHSQHARMLQSLYRQARLQGGIDVTNASMNMSNASNAALPRGYSSFAPAVPAVSSGSFDLPEPHQIGGYQQAGGAQPSADGAQPVAQQLLLDEAASKLKKEVETTTEEANKRINQASEAIRTLREKNSTREAELNRMRQDTEHLNHDADALDLENERLALQLERKRRVAPVDNAREQEMERLKRESDVLKEQKEALVAILEDLYGAAGKGNVTEEEAGAAIAASGGDRDRGAPKEETWSNMLPRPSELFASGILQADP